MSKTLLFASAAFLLSGRALGAQELARDQLLELAAREFGDQLAAARLGTGSPKLLLVVTHNGTVVRKGTFQLKSREVGGMLAVSACMPSVPPRALRSVQVIQVSGATAGLGPDVAMLLHGVAVGQISPTPPDEKPTSRCGHP